MRRRLLSARLERHMERGEELMELCRVAFRENKEALEANKQAFEENRQAFERCMQTFEDNRQFIRDMTRRSEKVVQELVRRDDAIVAEQSRRTDTIVAEMKDAREESRAFRQALFAVLDRLPPPQAA